MLGSNWGTVDYAYYPKAFCPGGSFAIDYTGMVMRHAPYPEEQVIAATIDIEALREHRSRCNHNTWVDLRTEGFRQIYEKPMYPPNQFPSGRPPRTHPHRRTNLRSRGIEPVEHPPRIMSGLITCQQHPNRRSPRTRGHRLGPSGITDQRHQHRRLRAGERLPIH